MARNLSARSAALAAVAVLFVVVALVGVVDARAGLHCEDVWAGPSKDNDLGKCVTDTGRINKTMGNYVLPALCILYLVLSLLLFPIVFLCCVCCQCCCYCCKDVPKERRTESKSSRKNLIVLMVIVFAISIAILAVMITGSADLVKGADDIFVNLNKHVVDYFNDLTYDLENTVRDNATGILTEPFTNATFVDIRSQIGDIKNTTSDFRDTLTVFTGIASKVGYGVAVFPLFVFSFTILFALCNCRRCCPSCCTCIYYLIGIIFSLIGFILLLLASVFGDVCAEIELQQSRQPGLFQWYAVPTCENTANFTDMKEQVTSNEANFARDFCKEISKYCSSSETFNAGTPADVFVCSTTDATAAADCPNFDLAFAILLNSYAKTGSNVCGGANCTFRQCPTQCSVATMQSNAADALKILDQAQRLFDALDLVLPHMDCNAVIDRVLRIFDSCPKIRDGLLKMGIAFFLTLIGIVFAWIIMFRGQKVWFSQQEYEEGEMEETELKAMDGVEGGRVHNDGSIELPRDGQPTSKKLES